MNKKSYDITFFVSTPKHIGGNKYRPIGYVHYRREIVYVKQILTEQEEEGWKE